MSFKLVAFINLNQKEYVMGIIVFIGVVYCFAGFGQLLS